MDKKYAPIFLIGVLAFVYQVVIKPQPPRICGTPGGPPITTSRIKLRNGRHLAYREFGVPKEVAKKKVLFLHGFVSTSKDTVIATRVPKELLEELGVYIVTYDRAGYGESDPDPNRSVKSMVDEVEEFADSLELGSKFYIIGFSMGGQAVWACLKYIPHRIVGATMITPVINYWWHNFPSDLVTKAFYDQLKRDQWTQRVVYYIPWLTYWLFTQKWLPPPSVVDLNPAVFSTQDIEVLGKFIINREHELEIRQQGMAESLARDAIVGFGSWDFDPFDIENPFPDNKTVVHLWQGDEDLLISVPLQRYLGQNIPWVQYHEVRGGGHLFPYMKENSVAIVKTQLAD